MFSLQFFMFFMFFMFSPPSIRQDLAELSQSRLGGPKLHNIQSKWTTLLIQGPAKGFAPP